jgi:hypothetical protein
MPNFERVRLNPEIGFPSRLLWRLGWTPWLQYAIGALLAIAAGLALHSVYGFLFGLAVVIVRWKASVLINSSSARVLKLAEATVKAAGAKRVGIDLDASECKIIVVGRGNAPLGVRMKPEYNISAVYVCDTFFGIFPDSTLGVPDFELRLATSGDETYFRHVSAITYHDSAIEILLSQGKKSKRIAVGSEVSATAVLEALRAKLRSAHPARQAVAVHAAGHFEEGNLNCVAQNSNGHGPENSEDDGETRFCYLRSSKLAEYYSDQTVLTALLEQLQVPGTAATLARMNDRDKREAIETQIDHFRRTPNSFWYGVAANEVLAASIWRARGQALRRRLVQDKFCKVSREDDLLRPVARWLTARGESPYMEIPLGRRRIDALGFKKAGLTGSPRLTAVELKNDDEQFRRGPDQMGTFAEYVHGVYLACTPAFAAEYLERNAENRNVNHWDSSVLDRKLKQGGFGLLLVERDNVFETIKPVEQSPIASNVSKVIAGLTDFQAIDLD